jgi:hypothetical protein
MDQGIPSDEGIGLNLGSVCNI